MPSLCLESRYYVYAQEESGMAKSHLLQVLPSDNSAATETTCCDSLTGDDTAVEVSNDAMPEDAALAKNLAQRPKTMSRREMLREQRRRERAGEVVGVPNYPRPKTRGDCAKGPRPCLFVACKHHLYLDVNPETGSVKINFPDKEVWELEHTCALDVAERGGITLEEVGEILNLTRERVRQVEVTGLQKLHVSSEKHELDAFIGWDPFNEKIST